MSHSPELGSPSVSRSRAPRAAAVAALAGSGALAAVTWISTARAQEKPSTYEPYQTLATDPLTNPDVEADEIYFGKEMAPPARAFEFKVGSGYTQGFGKIAPGTGMGAVAGAGLGVSADLDFRIGPRLSLGVSGQYQEFSNELNTAARGFVGNVGVTYHFLPTLRGDPWARLGAGYRLLWSVDPVDGGPTTLVHGFELATASCGYDVRLSRGLAMAPMVGMDLNMFVWESANGSTRALSSAAVGTFLFVGLQGRFDAGPASRTPTSVATTEHH